MTMTMNEAETRKKTFNTAGLCFPEDHYMVNPLKRMQEVEQLIEQKLYFTLHAPRQTGKTTYLHALARKLNAEAKYIALVVSFERAGVAGMTLETANDTVMNAIYNSSTRQLEETYLPVNPTGKNFPDLYNYLQTWSDSQEKPIVLFIDEIDALLDNVLISILRQLRDGYQGRPKHFPSSVALVGLRDVREYKAKIRDGYASLGTASPFNVKSESLLLKNFSREEVYELLEQHTLETGQVFPGEVKEEIYRLSGGQPWLTNALARQIVSKILGDDYSKPITFEIVKEAKDHLISRRDTHLDSLVDKLKEDRVKKIVQAIINGDNLPVNIFDDDILYIRDLGIVSQSSPLEFANPVYAEIIPRIIASPLQESIPKEIQTPWFLRPDGSLDMEKLLKEFQEFYRRNSGAWLDRYEYKESAHHLLLMAFLQRVINSGGEIIREMALGNGRIDMLVKFGKQEFALELKIKRDKYTVEDGKKQLGRYLDRLGLKQGYLVIFDPGPAEWEEKLYYQEIPVGDKKITMVGL
ncbi:MAG: AAA-like domain-containing protein [Candidatus Aminicenantes bacterium]|nr:AAA-like domain-containing protein [Candidatus Aminicenantes bacterium]